MHNHIFKVSESGEFTNKDGQKYDCKAVMYHEVSDYVAKGWRKSLEDALAIDHEVVVEAKKVPEKTEEEKEIREKIKKLGGIPAGRSSLDKLKTQLAELEESNNGDINEG